MVALEQVKKKGHGGNSSISGSGGDGGNGSSGSGSSHPAKSSSTCGYRI